jgi:hypothetical protein
VGRGRESKPHSLSRLGQPVTVITYVRRCPVSILFGKTILSEGFHGFPQSIKANAGDGP